MYKRLESSQKLVGPLFDNCISNAISNNNDDFGDYSCANNSCFCFSFNWCTLV